MSRKVLAVTVSLVMAFLMAACGPLGKPSVDEIVSHLQKSQEQQMHMHAIETFSFQPPKGASGEAGAPGKVVMEEWMAGPDKMRIEYKDGPAQIKGTVIVFDGKTMWTYNPTENTYMRMKISNFSDVGGPSPEAMKSFVRQALDTYDFKFLGTDDMAGRKVYKIEATTKKGKESAASGVSKMTLWVDAKNWNMLGGEMEGTMGHMSWRTEKVEYNPKFPAGLFEFTPPKGAREISMKSPQMETVDTIEEAQKKVKFHILKPSYLPEGYEMRGVRLIEPSAVSKTTTVLLFYRKGGKPLVISEIYQSGATSLPEPTKKSGFETKEIEVRGKKARLLERTGEVGSSVSWIEGDLMVTISGHVEGDEVVKIAKSLR